MTLLVIFCSTFAVVFLLGLQSLSVNGGHKVAAFCNSCLIGVANITILKVVPNAQGLEIVVYILAGPLGIVSSMYFFGWLRGRKAMPPAPVVAPPVAEGPVHKLPIGPSKPELWISSDIEAAVRRMSQLRTTDKP